MPGGEPQGLGSVLATRAGVASAKGKAGKRVVVAPVGRALGSATLDSAVAVSSPAAAPDNQARGPAIGPLHGRPPIIYLLLIVAMVGSAALFIGAQFRTVLRTHR